MRSLIYFLLITFLFSSCTNTANKEENRIMLLSKGNVDLDDTIPSGDELNNNKLSIVKDNLIGIWGDDLEENSLFQIFENYIIYTEHQDASYLYILSKDTMIIKYPDYENKSIIKHLDNHKMIYEDFELNETFTLFRYKD